MALFVGPVHCSLDPQTSFFTQTLIKNWSYSTIHIFKNYFATVFSVSAKISCRRHFVCGVTLGSREVASGPFHLWCLQPTWVGGVAGSNFFSFLLDPLEFQSPDKPCHLRPPEVPWPIRMIWLSQRQRS